MSNLTRRSLLKLGAFTSLIPFVDALRPQADEIVLATPADVNWLHRKRASRSRPIDDDGLVVSVQVYRVGQPAPPILHFACSAHGHLHWCAQPGEGINAGGRFEMTEMMVLPTVTERP